MYLASSSSKFAVDIDSKPGSSGFGFMLLCDVYLGSRKKMVQPKPDPQADDPAKRAAEKYDSVYAEQGAMLPGDVADEEVVVFSPDLCVPRYLIMFKPSVPAPLAASWTLPPDRDFEVVRIRRGEHSLESHEDRVFRQAESQYLRLTLWTDTTTARPAVQQVDWYRVRTVLEAYEATKACLHGVCDEELVFHGTQASKIESIMSKGLLVGGKDIAVAVGQAHGQGEPAACPPM